MMLIWHLLILLIFLIYLIFIFVFFGKKRCAKLETQQRLMLRSFMCHRQVRLLLFSKPWKPKCHWLCASPRVFPSTTWFASNTPWFASRRAVWSDQIVQELSHQSRWVHQRHPSLVGNVLHCFVWFAVQNRHYASCRPQKRIDRCCIAFGYLDIRGCQPDHRNRLGTDIVRRHRWRSVQRHRFHRLSRSVPQRSRNQRYHSDWWDRWTSRREGCRIFAAAQSGKHFSSNSTTQIECHRTNVVSFTCCRVSVPSQWCRSSPVWPLHPAGVWVTLVLLSPVAKAVPRTRSTLSKRPALLLPEAQHKWAVNCWRKCSDWNWSKFHWI